jgi:predicted RNA-binding Zn-ribbon protein involved in translation (DUF1610 family)
MTDSLCPECGAQPTDESVIYEQLSHLGYHHTDTRYECSMCGEKWIVGEPHGTIDNDTWVCDSCGGDYIPHFLYINSGENTIRVRPKCKDCFYLPKERIELESKFNGENIRGFVGHHLTTGDMEDSEDSPI